jgi:uncharacterized protein with HEPN domain
MAEAADANITYTNRGREAFDSDAALRDAILYRIVVLGEAAKEAIAADREIAWQTATIAVPELRAALTAALARLR